MMSRHWKYLVIIVLNLIAVRSMPLAQSHKPRICLSAKKKGDLPSEAPQGEEGLNDRRPHRVAKRDADPDGRLSIADVATRPEVQAERLSSMDTEPQCLLHHEYAEILGTTYHGANDSRVKSFVNRHNETRYYICLPCRVCPPGVMILSHCHRRRDTVCGFMCVDPDHVYDTAQQICVPSLTPTDEISVSSATPSSQPTPDLVRTMGKYFVKDGGDGVGIDDEAVRMTTVIRPLGLISSQVTVITVGIISLNVLVMVTVVIIIKRFKCKRRQIISSSGYVNNALSSVSTFLRQELPSDIPQTEAEDPCTNQVECKRNDMPTSVGQSSGIQGGGVSQSPDQGDNELMGQPHHQAKECNLNVFHEPGFEQVDGMVQTTQNGGSTSRPPIQVLRGKDPFWLVMLGQFGPEGGVLSCEDSDVILEIPPGAIPADRQDQLIIARVSLRPDTVGPKMKDPDSMWLTPLVEFESPGLERFNKDVRMRLPHSACLQPGWDFRVHYTDPTAATKKSNSPTDPSECHSSLLHEVSSSSAKWFGVKQKFHLSESGKCRRAPSVETGDVTFTVDEKFFNVSTAHFSKYCCSGCHKEHPLHMEAVVYCNHIKVEGHEQMDLNVYIVDPIKDSRMMVEKNEKSSKHKVGYCPFILLCKKKSKGAAPLEICMKEDRMGDDWKWRLDTCNGCFPAKRVLQISSLVRCCSPLLPSCESFSFRPKTSTGNEMLNIFQAVIGIKQQNWSDDDWKHIRVTVPLTKGSIKNMSEINNNQEGTVITDEQIELVVDQLPYNKLRPLYRQLIGEGADNGIERIVVQRPNDSHEQIHEALVSWRRSKGRQATPAAMGRALEAIKEIKMAEDFQQDAKGGLLIQEIRHHTCQETAV